MKTIITSIDNIELEIPLHSVYEICHSGDNSEAVTAHLDDRIKEQLNQYTIEELAQAVEAYGIEDTETMTIEELQEYILWIGAWDIFDGLA